MMIINSIICLIRITDKSRSQGGTARLALLLNCSWIYYIKVIVYGTTIGNL
jgi:hypothetical protein